MRLHPVHELGDVVVHTVVRGLHAERQQVSQNPPELGERVLKFHFQLGFTAPFTLCDCTFFTKVVKFLWENCHREMVVLCLVSFHHWLNTYPLGKV